MEGIVHLRELVERSRKSTRECLVSCEELVCSSGFLHSSRADVKRLCALHGISYSGDLHVPKTTHLIIPLTKRDLNLCPVYAETVLKTDKVMRCWEEGIPVVCLDWLFARVSRVCEHCRVYNKRAGFDEAAYNEHREYAWAPVDEEACCAATPGFLDEASPSDLKTHVSPTQQLDCTGVLECQIDSEYERTPDVFDSDLLRDFAQVKVTPICHDEDKASEFTFGQVLPEDSCDQISENVSSEAVSDPPGQESFIPGDLLLRFPKGNAVRKRHGIQSRAPGLVQFTHSMIFKHFDYKAIDAKVKHVAFQVRQSNRALLLVKPLHYYRILGQDWMLEYRPFSADENGSYELKLSTSVDSCPVTAISGIVPVSALNTRTTKSGVVGPPMRPLSMISTTTGQPPYYYYRDE